MEVYSGQRRAHPAATLLGCAGFLLVVLLLCLSLSEQKRTAWEPTLEKQVDLGDGISLQIPRDWGETYPRRFGPMEADSSVLNPHFQVQFVEKSYSLEQTGRLCADFDVDRVELIRSLDVSGVPGSLAVARGFAEGPAGPFPLMQALVHVALPGRGTLVLHTEPTGLGRRETILLLERIASGIGISEKPG